MVYKARITGCGDMVAEMLEHGMMILFDENAPPELAELSVLHTHAELKRNPAPGDTLSIGSAEYTITAVGEEANKTLRTMGHCSLVFHGKAEVDLPGQIALKGKGMPKITIGDVIEIK